MQTVMKASEVAARGGRHGAGTVPPEERQRVPPFRTPRFDRTLSQWVDMIRAAGLAIEKFGEPCASPELAGAEPVVADTSVAPMFPHVRARKPAGAC